MTEAKPWASGKRHRVTLTDEDKLEIAQACNMRIRSLQRVYNVEIHYENKNLLKRKIDTLGVIVRKMTK